MCNVQRTCCLYKKKYSHVFHQVFCDIIKCLQAVFVSHELSLVFLAQLLLSQLFYDVCEYFVVKEFCASFYQFAYLCVH